MNGSSERNAPSLVACMCAKSSTGRTHVVLREISTTSSSDPRSRTRPITSTPNVTARSLPSSRSRSVPSCSTTASSASSRLRPSRNPGWKTTSSAPRRGGDTGAAVERSHRGGELAPARLQMAHEPEERRVHRERDVVLSGELAEPLRERVVHPEAALEVDLARGVPAFAKDVERLLGRLARGKACRADADPRGHTLMLLADVIGSRE